MPISRRQLQDYWNEVLQPQSFSDYCPNGLQVEGRDSIQRLISGVTASQAFIDAAIAEGADALLVHHGWFWKGEPAVITGMKKRRLASVLAADINLFAWHLPLDAHPEVGNNACLGKLLGLGFGEPVAGTGEPALCRIADVPPGDVGLWAEKLQTVLGREPLLEKVGDRPVRRVAWCTGAAQSYIDAVAAAGADLFITGEVSEPTIHSARELGLHFAAAGHHATERYGVQALGELTSKRWGIEHRFIDIPNPV